MAAVYREIVRKDCYMMKFWNSDFFDNIVDIGANVGCFTIYSHMRHPKANIFAYEPCKETFQNLVETYNFIEHTTFINKALGDGSCLFFYDTGWSGCNLFFKSNESEFQIGYSIESLPLKDMFKEHQISLESKYYIKIDCEGGERFLLDDNESISIMKNACGCGIEVHFPPEGDNGRVSSKERFKTFPKWETYNTWMYDNFYSTHNIIYHCSSGKMGNGVYILQRKDMV